MKKFSLVSILVTVLIVTSYSQEKSQTQLMIRCDDMGMCHSVNMAIRSFTETKIPFSTSVMFNCPWYLEAAEILKDQPHVSIGVHLTLNSEWKNYRWGPVLGKEAVPSLVDKNGYFFPSRKDFHDNNPKPDEIEKELRAQIERAKNTGLNIDYVDYHMGTAVDKPEHREIVEKLAKEYGLAISRYFGEVDAKNLYSDPIENKTDSLITVFNKLDPASVNLMVCHLGLDTPELASMQDMNPWGMEFMSKHRNAELNALKSSLFNYLAKEHNIEFLTYKNLVKTPGLEKMKRPDLSGY
ncbi:MAG: ChbG/HpnK family deacetylase [Melioribacteraceae bacterium]|nr:ChbG/HpnK family deacetylase [Melioribacteraceae bacterium]